jgi:hypothetical protein
MIAAVNHSQLLNKNTKEVIFFMKNIPVFTLRAHLMLPNPLPEDL